MVDVGCVSFQVLGAITKQLCKPQALHISPHSSKYGPPAVAGWCIASRLWTCWTPWVMARAAEGRRFYMVLPSKLHAFTRFNPPGNTMKYSNEGEQHQIVEVATKTMNCLCEVQLQKGRRERTLKLKLLNEWGTCFHRPFGEKWLHRCQVQSYSNNLIMGSRKCIFV